MKRALSWVARLTGGDLVAPWVIECAATFGARLARTATGAGYDVVEAARMNARAHHGVGKSDCLDAHHIGAAVLPLELDQLRHPRAAGGVRAALRVLTTAREHMSTARVNALTALLRILDLGTDARRPLTNTQITEVASWRNRVADLAPSVARAEAVRPAKRIHALNVELAKNNTQLKKLLEQSEAAPLLDQSGLGPVT